MLIPISRLLRRKEDTDLLLQNTTEIVLDHTVLTGTVETTATETTAREDVPPTAAPADTDLVLEIDTVALLVMTRIARDPPLPTVAAREMVLLSKRDVFTSAI